MHEKHESNRELCWGYNLKWKQVICTLVNAVLQESFVEYIIQVIFCWEKKKQTAYYPKRWNNIYQPHSFKLYSWRSVYWLTSFKLKHMASTWKNSKNLWVPYPGCGMSVYKSVQGTGGRDVSPPHICFLLHSLLCTSVLLSTKTLHYISYPLAVLLFFFVVVFLVASL